ncbi:tyrosine-type recombinase/integrase [Methylomonas sp. 11b]|uniref:tyrosine-type recombinase/integrase n=1 Tax=Methylomonas sp. 11b TaxID=1168169 RepID=UPI00047E9735|nr:site-specific integrase [Methylomonas sp. 11b]
MATIRKIERQSGVVYKAIITQRGIAIKSKTFTRKGDAQAWVKRIESDHEMMEALGSRGAGLRFADLVDEYMRQWQGKDAVNQARRAQYWQACLGDYKLVDISADMIRQRLKAFEAGKVLRGDGAGKTKAINRDRSPSTVNRYRTVLSAIFRYAIFEGYVVANPVARVAARKVNNQINRFLDEGERVRLLAACQKSDWDKLHLLVLMALTSGMRKAEVLNLRWSDIDFDNNLARLATSKNGEPRWCPLPDFVVDQLRPLRQVGVSLIFASENKPERPFEFKKHWDKALREAGIENFRFHDLRHSAASLLAMSGASLYEVGEVLGHKSTQTTKRYAHLSTEHKSKLVERVMTAAIRQK